MTDQHPQSETVNFTPWQMTSPGEEQVISIPEHSEWVMWFAPKCYWRPTKGGEPNWFHRWMQQMCFGVKWEKVP